MGLNGLFDWYNQNIIKILSKYYQIIIKTRIRISYKNNYCDKLVPQIDTIDKFDQEATRPMKQLFFEKGQKE